jgi:hypothetical protein
MEVKNSISIILLIYTLNNVILSSAGKKLIGPLLLKLEKDINKMILNPEPAYSDRLILDLLYYCRTLIRLSYMVDDREEAAKEIAQYLFKEGGPAFLQAQVNNDHLMDCLNWNKEDVKNLYFLFEKVKLLWVEFHKTYKRNIVWFV